MTEELDQSDQNENSTQENNGNEYFTPDLFSDNDELLNDERDDLYDELYNDNDILTSEPTSELIHNTIGNFLETASVDKVYGEPIETDDALIIPAAEILSVLGFGIGNGPTETDGKNYGGGGGGGGRILSRPVAVIIATKNQVRVSPVVDVTKISLAGLTALGFMFTFAYRLFKGPRR